MKPIAIFRHHYSEGPGYFATFLDQRSIPWQLFKIDQNEAIPKDPTAFSGLAFMGGPMSVNDPLPWIAEAVDLTRSAVATNIPVLGHCLGGQLMAKAMGGVVTKNSVKEIGWGDVSVLENLEAQAWFGDLHQFRSFHWHGETFSIPNGAQRVLESPWCANQAFVIGPHLGLQCHVEMTAEMIEAWCTGGAEEIAQSDSPAVQTALQIYSEMEAQLPALNAVADTLYKHWIKGLIL